MFTLSLSAGAHPDRSVWNDSKMGSSLVAESEAITEFIGKKKEEDTASIKGEENLEIRYT